MPFWMNILDFKKDNCLLFLDRIWTFIAGQRWITSQVDDGYVVISEAVLTWMHLACSQWSNSQSWRFWGRSANDMWRRVHWRARIVLWAKSLRHHHRQRKGYINEVIQFSKWLSGVQQILISLAWAVFLVFIGGRTGSCSTDLNGEWDEYSLIPKTTFYKALDRNTLHTSVKYLWKG